MNETPTIHRRDMLVAEQVATRLPAFLTSRNLTPAFSNFFVTRDLNMTLFIAVLDTSKIGDHSRYTQQEFLHQLSTDLDGLRVYLSNSTGLRYVIPLSPLPKLPRSVELPADVPIGLVALGVRFNGQVVLIPWSKLGHLLIVGMTGSGKSSLLRSIVMQAIRNGLKLLLADIDQTTFAVLEGHEDLFAPIATTAQDALQLILKALNECDQRAAVYKSMPGFPENIDEYNTLAIKAGKESLPRILVVLDESSAVLKAMGGGSGELAGKIAELGWRGRKFGIHFIFGAQEFTKDLVGAVRRHSLHLRRARVHQRPGGRGARTGQHVHRLSHQTHRRANGKSHRLSGSSPHPRQSSWTRNRGPFRTDAIVLHTQAIAALGWLFKPRNPARTRTQFILPRH